MCDYVHQVKQIVLKIFPREQSIDIGKDFEIFWWNTSDFVRFVSV